MTLKHIGFFDSAVMRELARQETKKGAVRTTAAEIVKEASEKKGTSYEAGNDLFADMVRLASGLRSKGFVSEAQGLEEKLLQFKRAERDAGEAFLDEAHPEGDAKMGEAEDGLGDVETLPSRHRKILEVVNKKPTGKQAQAAALLEAAAQVLKVAQTSDGTETVQDFFSDSRVAREKAIHSINEGVAKSAPQVAGLIRNSLDSFYNSLTLQNPVFYQGFISGNAEIANVYGTFAGVSGDKVIDFYKRCAIAYGSPDKVDDNYLFAQLNKSDSKAVASFVRSVAPSVDVLKFIPPPPTEEQLTTWQKTKNFAVDVGKWLSPIGWVYMGGQWIYDMEKDTKAVQGIFQAVKSALEADYTNLVSKAIIDRGNETLKAEALKSCEPFETAFRELSSITPLPREATSNAEMLGQLDSIKSKIETGIPSVTKSFGSVPFDTILKIFNTDVSAGMRAVLSGLIDMEAAVKSHPISTNDKVHPSEEVESMAAKLFEASKRIATYTKGKFKEGTPQFNNWMAQAQQFLAASKKIAASKGKTFQELASALEGIFPVKSYEDLQAQVNYYSDGSQKLASSAPDVIKLGQMAPPGAATAKPAAQPGAQAAPAGAISPEEKDAVQAMQLSLMTLGQYVQRKPELFPKSGANAVPPLLQVGKGEKNVQMDGAWGPNTAKALGKAQELLNEWNQTHSESPVSGTVAVGPMRYQGAAAAAAAKANATLINSLISVAFGVDTGNGTNLVYDKLAKNTQFSQTDLMANPDHGGMYPVTGEVMRSMASLYSFLVGQVGVEPQTTESNNPEDMPERGLTIQKWTDIIKWFMSRAKYRYGQLDPKDSKGRDRMTNYHADAQRIWNQLVNYCKAAKLTFQDLNRIIPENQIPGSNSGQGQARGRGRSGSVGEAYEGGLGGQDWGAGGGNYATLPPPINPVQPGEGNIDLTLPWYGNIITEFGIGQNSVLDFNTFSSTPPLPIIQALFGSDKNPALRYQEFLSRLSESIKQAVSKWATEGQVAGKTPNAQQRTYLGNWMVRWQSVLQTQYNKTLALQPGGTSGRAQR